MNLHSTLKTLHFEKQGFKDLIIDEYPFFSAPLIRKVYICTATKG